MKDSFNKYIVKRLEFELMVFALRRIENLFGVWNHFCIYMILSIMATLPGFVVWIIMSVINPSMSLNYVFPLFISFTLTPLVLSFIPYELIEEENKLLKNLSIFILLAFPLVLAFYDITTNLLNLLPGKRERNNEIDHFTFMWDEKTRDQLEAANQLRDPFIYSLSLKNETDKFLSDHFHSNQAFKRFFLERILVKNKVLHYKLLFLLLIPRKKEMPVNTLREIILACNFPEKSLFLNFDQVELLHHLVKENSVDEYFSGLTIDQIKLIFTRPFHPEDYFGLLSDLSYCTNSKLNPATNMLDLIENAPMTQEKMEARLHHKYLRRIHNFIPPQYSLKLLLSPREFNEGGELFSNCVAGYKQYDSDIFIITEGEDPVACVEIKNHKINEIKGYQNNQVSDKLFKLVKSALDLSRR